MKFSTLTSVGAKLFYYMSSLVLITVAVSSFQYAKTFSSFLQNQVQDSMQQQAESVAAQFENTIEMWRSQIAVALPTLRAQEVAPPTKGTKVDKTAEVERGEAGLHRFVDANPEFLWLQLFSAPSASSSKLTSLNEAFTSNTADKYFEEKEPSKVRSKVKSAALAWLKKEGPRAAKKTNVLIESLAKPVGLPIMLMAVRFDVADSNQVVWALLATWQNNLIKGLPKGRFTSSAVIDTKGQVFTSPDMADMIERKTLNGPLVKQALSGPLPSGFENEYKDSDGHRKLGAFSRMPRYDLSVLMEMDAEFAYATLRKNLMMTGLYAALFMMIAVMFSFFGAAGITKGLRAVTFATSRIAAGDFKYQIPAGSKDEVGALGAAINNMSRKIVDLMQTQVEKTKIEKELETAQVVQNTFFPDRDIHSASLHISGFYQPATKCGGDLWGHVAIEPGIDFLFIGDAMGHGAAAALVTAMAYATTMTLADVFRTQSAFRDSPSKILERINRVLFDAVEGTISMTFFAMIIDTVRGEIIFANAGHNFPVIIPVAPGDPRSGKPSKQGARHGGLQPISLKLQGVPLGMSQTATFKEQRLPIKAGDKIFLFTDGLIECSSPKSEVWGRKHLLEQVLQTSKLGAEEMKDEVVGRAFSFFSTRPLDDDVTVVVAEIAADWQPSQRPAASNSLNVSPKTAAPAVGAASANSSMPSIDGPAPAGFVTRNHPTPPPPPPPGAQSFRIAGTDGTGANQMPGASVAAATASALPTAPLGSGDRNLAFDLSDLKSFATPVGSNANLPLPPQPMQMKPSTLAASAASTAASPASTTLSSSGLSMTAFTTAASSTAPGGASPPSLRPLLRPTPPAPLVESVSPSFVMDLSEPDAALLEPAPEISLGEPMDEAMPLAAMAPMGVYEPATAMSASTEPMLGGLDLSEALAAFAPDAATSATLPQYAMSSSQSPLPATVGPPFTETLLPLDSEPELATGASTALPNLDLTAPATPGAAEPLPVAPELQPTANGDGPKPAQPRGGRYKLKLPTAG